MIEEVGRAEKKKRGRPSKISLQMEAERKEKLLLAKKENLTFFFKLFPWQEKAFKVIRTKNTTSIISCNKIGKSALGVNTVISWELGYEPWSPVDESDPDAVLVDGSYFRKSSLGIKPPVKIIIVGEDWKLHIGQTIVPELKKWLPKGSYTTKKNEQGVEYIWDFNNGSQFVIMCYTQDSDLFESFRAQGAWEDEPPARDKHMALSRGLLLDGGKTLMTLTPLKEAWILDDIVLSGREDIGVIAGLKITENPILCKDEMNVLKELGLVDEEQRLEYFRRLLYEDYQKKTPVVDRGKSAEAYIKSIAPFEKYEQIGRLKILKFVKDIDPSDAGPRILGQFKSLVGRVLKNFDADTHIIKPFKIPADWFVTVLIDWHPSTPQAISYWAVDKHDFHYCIREVWKNMPGEEIADDIIIMKRTMGWNVQKVFIDPLAKGSTAYIRNVIGVNIKDDYSIINDKLSEEGISLAVAPKDPDRYVRSIDTMLKGENGRPVAYLFDNLERHLFEIQRWVYEDDKPKEENNHFMVNWARYAIVRPLYADCKITPMINEGSALEYNDKDAYMAI